MIFGATSPDGLAWTALPDPVMFFMAEGAFAGAYDHDKRACVAYMRHWYSAQRRAVSIAETRDFRRFPRPRPVLVPGYDTALHTDFYTNGHTLYPGTTDVHLMFVGEYTRGLDDCLALRLATSVDGDAFHLVPGRVAPFESDNWTPDTPDLGVNADAANMPSTARPLPAPAWFARVFVSLE
jgi:hypothetical protein